MEQKKLTITAQPYSMPIMHAYENATGLAVGHLTLELS